MTEMVKEQETATGRADAPAWWQRITSLYNDSVSHAFILHGNVRDYVLNGSLLSLEGYLVTRLAQHDLIIQVDPRGLRFPVPPHRDTLIRLLNLPGAPKSPLITAVRNGEASSPAAQSLRETTSLLDWLLTDPTLTVEVAGDARPVKVGVLFSMGDLLLPDADLSRTDGTILARLIHWAMDFRIGQRHVLMLIAESLTGIHSELRRASARWDAVAIPLPDAAHRERMIHYTCQRFRDDLSLADGLTERGVAQATGGLSLKQVEDVLFRGMGAGGLTREQITERKQTIIAQEFADVLQVGDARFDLGAVGGYDDLKAWLVQRVITPWHEGMLRIGGLLMSGPPGTGKTQLAEALAGSAGVPFVVFRLSKILGQFVGSSERNLERALQAILSLAPCLLFIDELDQAVRRGEADAAGSQVDNRVFARLLEFLEDPARRGRVLVAAATNRPDLLDAALRSRFDRTLPVLPPTAADRQAILEQQAKVAGIEITADGVLDETEGWTGRNIRDLVTMVAELVQDGTTPTAAVQEAMTLYRPTLRDVAEMTALALREVSDLRLVPPEYRVAAGREREQAEPEPQAERRRATRL